MRRLLIYVAIGLWSSQVWAQWSAAEVNRRLGKGINLGNMFEAPAENAWGNPFKEDYLRRISELGFNHIRVPIRWDVPERTLLTAPYTLNPTFLNRIKSVVDLARQQNLMVILNMHHHDDLFANPEAHKARFLSQWEQIANFFKGYDQNVVFEVLNEPHDKLNGATWNVFFREALTTIRKTNPNRAVLIAPQNFNSVGGVRELDIPNDSQLILSIHYYDPFEFTHQGAEWVGGNADSWLGTRWENTQQERDAVAQQFAYAISVSKAKNIPIHVGEFGAYSKADLDSRVKWTNFLARWFESQGFSWAYWEFSAGFGIFNPTTNQYLTPLVDALLKTPLPPAYVIPTTTLYQSQIGNSNDPWTVALQGQAKATNSFVNGQATIQITESSTENWHVQLVRRNVPLQKDKRYFVSFTVETSVPMTFGTYLGMDVAPYSSYSGFKTFTAEKTFSGSYSFTMKSSDDPKARIVFDVGKNKGTFILKNFKIEVETLLLNQQHGFAEAATAYPNPATHQLWIKAKDPIKSWKLYNLLGVEVLDSYNFSSITPISLAHLPTGTYLLQFETNNETIRQRIIKN